MDNIKYDTVLDVLYDFLSLTKEQRAEKYNTLNKGIKYEGRTPFRFQHKIAGESKWLNLMFDVLDDNSISNGMIFIVEDETV